MLWLVPFPPTSLTVGAAVYPVPLVKTFTATTLPLATNAWAVAPAPVPSITTLGASV